jgi:hypothetical protein
VSTFQDCIVSYLDLNDLGALLATKSRRGVAVMRSLHQLVSSIAHTFAAHDEVCFWQDSVLLVAPVTAARDSYQRAMSDVERLKQAIDGLNHCHCHAVSIKGQSFPAPTFPRARRRPRTIYLSASSLAFSNCFEVEHHLSHRKADWYLDSRITSKIAHRQPDFSDPVILLPRNAKRDIHVFRGSFR